MWTQALDPMRMGDSGVLANAIGRKITPLAAAVVANESWASCARLIVLNFIVLDAFVKVVEQG